MKILIVCSATNQQIAPFIKEQAESLQSKGVIISFYLIEQKGIKGYLSALPGLKHKIKEFKPDIIHAHYGLSGLLANLQRNVPVITTFHGSDINDPRILRWSRWAIRLSRLSVFVSQKTVDIARVNKKFVLLPCGINTAIFHPIDKKTARQQLEWDTDGIYILFAGTKEAAVKNYLLAKHAIERIPEAKLIELKGYARDEVNLLLNATDVALLTSFSEGSPQFIKEAMACNCPIVSTDVGDVKLLIGNTEGCFISSFETTSVVECLHKALEFSNTWGRTDGRAKIESNGLTNAEIALRLIDIYEQGSRK